MSHPRASLILTGLLCSLVTVACAKGTGGTGDDDDDMDGSTGGADAPITVRPDAPIGGAPDAGNMCSKQPCSIVPTQCGCAPGMSCDLDGAELATGGTICRAANPAGTTSVPCTNDSDCAVNYVCLGNPGTCKQYCDADADCTAGAGDLCVIQIVFGSPPMDVPGAKVCSIQCNPLTSMGCAAGEGCGVFVVDPMANPVVNFTFCQDSGAGGQGATCNNGTADCQPNFGCFNDGMSNVCLEWCQVAPAMASCATGTSCLSLNPPAVIGTTEYGVCF